MGIMNGKKGIIFGVSNKRSIAYGIAKALHDEGAEIAFTYAGEIMESRVRPIAESMNAKLIETCNVLEDSEIENVFEQYGNVYDTLDFVVHSVAFAEKDDLSGSFYNTSRSGWNLALQVSAYSLVKITQEARKLMPNGGSILTLTYLGGEKAIPNYNVMGVAKSALESSVRYLAAELGEEGIRVNALSAGPVKTLAAKGISNFDILLKINSTRAPMKRNVTIEEIGNAGLYFCSDLSTAVSGETHHVDCGIHCIATCKEDAELVIKKM